MVEDMPQEKEQAMKTLLDNAIKNGNFKKGTVELHDMMKEFDDVLRVRLGTGPPDNVEPMVIGLEDNVRSVQARHLR